MTNEKQPRKTVLVTGGIRGIGLAISLAFLKKGYRVYAAYSSDEESAKTAAEKGIIAIRADVSIEKDVQELFARISRERAKSCFTDGGSDGKIAAMGEANEESEGVDILVNNAGVSLIKQIQDVSRTEWERLFSINVGGAFLCCREAAKAMISRKNGLIVNISSVWGEVGGSCESAYSASKSALLGFTKSLSKELGWSGIRVNSVSPGVIDTRMNCRFSKEETAALLDEIPLGRLGTGEDVAKAVLFLDDNDYVTGADIPVNGGFSVV